MDKKQARNEIAYRVIKGVLKSMLSEGLISESEYEEARRSLVGKLNPIIGSLE